MQLQVPPAQQNGSRSVKMLLVQTLHGRKMRRFRHEHPLDLELFRLVHAQNSTEELHNSICTAPSANEIHWVLRVLALYVAGPSVCALSESSKANVCQNSMIVPIIVTKCVRSGPQCCLCGLDQLGHMRMAWEADAKTT